MSECKYCSQIQKDGTTENLCNTSAGAMSIFVTKHKPNGKLTIEVESKDIDGSEYWDSIDEDISFCPFCGKAY